MREIIVVIRAIRIACYTTARLLGDLQAIMGGPKSMLVRFLIRKPATRGMYQALRRFK